MKQTSRKGTAKPRRNRRPPARAKAVSLALQGGGSHGAFTWGVLDRLLEDDRVEIEAISGTSAGAMNAAALADGMLRGGREGARAALARLWEEVARVGRFGPIQRGPFEVATGDWNLHDSPSYILFDWMSRFLSPYQFNPLNFNPLMDVLRAVVDFDNVRRCDQVKLFIATTSVRTGKIRIFENAELSAEAIMASACLPHLFQAVEIDGEPFWDGGYMGNPAIYPLIYRCGTRDVVIVQINPMVRDDTPKTTPDILDRLNEISFNSSLMREMRAIAFVGRLLEENRLDEARYKRMLIHRIDAPEEMAALGVSSKLNAEREFLVHLRDIGRTAAAAWLERNFEALGRRSTVDILADYL
ncbi:MAG: patatin-like phospholipase family protein [Kiloniellaceae bacterium]